MIDYGPPQYQRQRYREHPSCRWYRGGFRPHASVSTLVLAIALICLHGCGGDANESQSTATATSTTTNKPQRPKPPVPEKPELLAGYTIWREDCRNCHTIGRDGAPLIASAEAWAPRLAKGRETLYKHAIEGWLAPSMAEMPARGGNKNLSDDEVKLAVDYMIWAALDE